MPVGIMQVLNNTSTGLAYLNHESRHSFILGAATPQQETDRLVPSSITKDDTLPWYDAKNDEKHIQILVGNANIKLSERDAQFYFEYQFEKSWTSKSLGALSNGGQYVVKFDGALKRNGSQELSVTIYHYDTKLSASGDPIPLELLHKVPANVASINLQISI